MGYVFISYSSKNVELAEKIKKLLNDNQIKTWMAPADIPLGKKYAQVINRAIKDCDSFLLVLSKDAQASNWVSKEVERAITNQKLVMPVRIDDVILNDEFELYISENQCIAINDIDDMSVEEKLLAAMTNFAEPETRAQITEPDKRSQPVEKLKQTRARLNSIELTVWSPVNTDVYLNNKNNLVLRVDHNTGFDYRFNHIAVSGEFDLIFVSHGFEKIVSFDADTIGDRLDFRLQAILTRQEIIASYDRDEAISQLYDEPTAYAFKQLSFVGKKEDVLLLKSELLKLSSLKCKDQQEHYLIATCAEALGRLASRYHCLEEIVFIRDVYNDCKEETHYKHLFNDVLNDRDNHGL